MGRRDTEQNETKLNGRNNVGKKENKKKQRVVEQPCYGQNTTNLHPANTWVVGPQSRDLQRVWFSGGGKQPISGFQPGPFLGDCWDGNFVQIQVVSGWDYLMHAREVGSERSMALSIQGRGKGSQQNQMNHNLLWNGQWRGEKVLGMPRVSGGRITKQKWLVSHRGKREKSYRDSLV